MTIAKNFLKELLTIAQSTTLASSEKIDKAWEKLKEYEYTEEDVGSGSTSEYIYTFSDGSKARYVAYDEGDGSDITFSCKELSAYFITEYEDMDDWDYSWAEEE